MSRQLLLHIGTNKTGTTSIQETLHRAAEEGMLGDICYPQFKRRNHNYLAAVYKSVDRLPRNYRNRREEIGPEAFKRSTEDFKDELFQSIKENERTILSAEYLSRFADNEVHALATDLAQLGIEKIGVVVYVRNPASHYLSNVQQTLKASSTFVSPALWKHPVHQMLRAWGTEFQEVIVRPFERGRLVGGDAVRDFLNVASSFFGINELDIPAATENQSISAEGMIILQRYRQQFHSNAEDEYKRDSNQLLGILQRSMNTIPQTRPRLSASVERLIMDRHRSDLDSLWTDYRIDLRAGAGAGLGVLPANEEHHEGLRRLSDVTTILDEYDEDTVDKLLLYCVREAVKEQQKRSLDQVAKLRGQIVDLSRQIEDSKREVAANLKELQIVKERLDETLASRSWRWGHRVMLFLSYPRRLMKALRRGGRP